MKLKLAAATLAAAFASLSAPASAALEPEDASLVPLFVETCTRGSVGAEAILAGVTGSTDWTEVPNPELDIAALSTVPSMNMQGSFRRPESVRLWRRNVNGRRVGLVIARFPERNVYRHACVLLAPDIRNAMPYLDAMGEGMRTVGLSGRSTDLPHYREYGGRLADRRRARADIFSRTRLVGTENTMHLSIAFE